MEKGRKKYYCNREGTAAFRAHKDTRRSDFPVGQLVFHPCIDFLSSRRAGIKRRKAFDSARLRLHRGRGYYYRLLGPITLQVSLVAVVVARRASRRFPFEDFSPGGRLGGGGGGWKMEEAESMNSTGARANGLDRDGTGGYS